MSFTPAKERGSFTNITGKKIKILIQAFNTTFVIAALKGLIKSDPRIGVYNTNPGKGVIALG